jgi:hypothetical protein
MNPRILHCLAGVLCAGVALSIGAPAAQGQAFRYEPKLKVGSSPSYASPDPAPRMMLASEALPPARPTAQRGYLAPPRGRLSMAQSLRYDSAPPSYSSRARGGPRQPTPAESIAPGQQVAPFSEELPPQNEHVDSGHFEGQHFDGPFEAEHYDGQYMDGPDFDGQYVDGDEWGEGECPGCGGRGGCDECGPCYIDLVHSFGACLRHTYLFSSGMWKNFSIYSGKQAFKGPTDLGLNGDFGFHGGLNWGSPLWNKFGIGYQLGGAIIASDFEGQSGPLQHRRTQYYVTTGLFRRADWNGGLQGGAVFDYLHDDFYVNMDLMQIRGEISYVYHGHELGFWFAAHTNGDTQAAPTFLEQQSVTWQANDQYNGYYRYQFCNGAVARSWIGLTSHADGIFGGDATIPFAKKWAIQTSYNYLLPNGDSSVSANVKESWNLSIAMVWYPGIKSPCDWLNPYRPLFPVADNGWFLEAVK